jgi:hypothetical protein
MMRMVIRSGTRSEQRDRMYKAMIIKIDWYK